MGIDPAPLKTYLGGADKSKFRAKDGVAHFAGSKARATQAALGIEGMTNVEAFESVIARITTMLETITGLLEAALPEAA
ncbi:hypothetical protein [Nocardia asiatica]|uniref:hypothetical protein n=1 Tax=Nocardia asiatica TaxID=209252 RepID=UPI003EE01699